MGQWPTSGRSFDYFVSEREQRGRRLEKYAGVMRPAHIHFRVSEMLHAPLTTQLYFKGDPEQTINGD
jgi:protocatechuate 3,4-dioxygenase beta subunit